MKAIPLRYVQLAHYLVVGAINTAFGYGVYALAIGLAAPLWLAALFAQVLGTLFNYFTYGSLVFKAAPSWPQIARFAIGYTFTYGLGVGCLYFLNNIGLNAYWAGIVNLGIMPIASFFINKYFVFKQKKVMEQP